MSGHRPLCMSEQGSTPQQSSLSMWAIMWLQTALPVSSDSTAGAARHQDPWASWSSISRGDFIVSRAHLGFLFVSTGWLPTFRCCPDLIDWQRWRSATQGAATLEELLQVKQGLHDATPAYSCSAPTEHTPPAASQTARASPPQGQPQSCIL